MKSKDYKKIPGKLTGLLANSQLFMGEDHLLCVSDRLTTQNYRRFFFADIEAIQIIYTERRTAWLSFSGLGLVISLIAGSGRGFDSPLILGALLLFVFSFVFALGRGLVCKLQLQTKAGVVKLKGTLRLSSARKIIQLIDENIEKSQAPINVEGGNKL